MAFETFSDVVLKVLGYDLGDQTPWAIRDRGAPWVSWATGGEQMYSANEAAGTHRIPSAQEGQLRFWKMHPSRSGLEAHIEWSIIDINEEKEGGLGAAQEAYAKLPQALGELIGSKGSSVFSAAMLKLNRDVLKLASDWTQDKYDKIKAEMDQLKADDGTFRGEAYEAYFKHVRNTSSKLEGIKDQFESWKAPLQEAVDAAVAFEKAVITVAESVAGPWSPLRSFARTLGAASVWFNGAKTNEGNDISDSGLAGQTNDTRDSAADSGVDLSVDDYYPLLIDVDGKGGLDTMRPESWTVIDHKIRTIFADGITKAAAPLIEAANVVDEKYAKAADALRLTKMAPDTSTTVGDDAEDLQDQLDQMMEDVNSSMDESLNDVYDSLDDVYDSLGTGVDTSGLDAGVTDLGSTDLGSTDLGSTDLGLDTGAGSTDLGLDTGAGSTDLGLDTGAGSTDLGLDTGAGTTGLEGLDTGAGTTGLEGLDTGAGLDTPLTAEQQQALADAGLPVDAGSTLGDLTPEQQQALADAGLLDTGTTGLVPLASSLGTGLTSSAGTTGLDTTGLTDAGGTTLGDLTDQQLRALSAGGGLDDFPVTDEQRAVLGDAASSAENLGDLSVDQLRTLQDAGLLPDVPLTAEQQQILADAGLPVSGSSLDDLLSGSGSSLDIPLSSSDLSSGLLPSDVLTDDLPTGAVAGGAGVPSLGDVGSSGSVPVKASAGMPSNVGGGIDRGGLASTGGGNPEGTGWTQMGTGSGAAGVDSSSGMPMMPMMGGMGGGGAGGGGDKKDRERTTWLVEDEDVWGTSTRGVAAVIGRGSGSSSGTLDDLESEVQPAAAKTAARQAASRTARRER